MGHHVLYTTLLVRIFIISFNGPKKASLLSLEAEFEKEQKVHILSLQGIVECSTGKLLLLLFGAEERMKKIPKIICLHFASQNSEEDLE